MIYPDAKYSNITLSPDPDCRELIYIRHPTDGTVVPLLVKDGSNMWVVNSKFQN